VGQGVGPGRDGLPARESFREAAGTAFRIQLDDARSAELALVQVDDLDTRSGWEAFSLVFEGRGEPFPQATYSVEHGELGTFPLFLVPILAEDGGQRYEAVFNRPTR
jgi:hypothetical protein